MASQSKKEWYEIDNIESIDSPVLVLYRSRLLENIHTLISMTDDIKRLRPHVKTHKTKEVAELMIAAGIKKFKCAIIAEAEMLGISNAPDVLLAYQPLGPKLQRFIDLTKKYPATKFSCLVDNITTALQLAENARMNNVVINIFIDINVGMNRTGINPGNEAIDLFKRCHEMQNLHVIGLHAYDGHIRNKNFEQRKIECDTAFADIVKLKNILVEQGYNSPVIIAGGSPTFPIHVQRKNIECSPGTFIFWDYNYQTNCPEQSFHHAALVIGRIISIPSKNKICIDIGHKSVASENEIDRRIIFLNAPELKCVSQSEEHLVAETNQQNFYKVGDVLYGLPYHICPTVALYERALIVDNNKVVDEWRVMARDRKITI